MGGKRIEHFSWNIKVRNAKNIKAKMLLKEPIPLSRNSEIKVELADTSGGQLNQKTGMVSWEFNLAPGAQKEVDISYSIEYPKGRQVPILNYF
ncbi:MAG: DUF4139 domain-containing protein [Owenweeksia sp.]|nr:DUF4139 domain-containing protein [Owenweeksia sp.]